MYYNEMCGVKVPALGFGTMRLPETESEAGADTAEKAIDQAQVEQMVDYAMSHGVNYFDTAWGYHGGKSEVALGKALSRYDRSDFLVADKFPGYDVTNFGKHEQIFEEQLERTGLDHFDFYLIHNVCELNIEQYLDEDRYHTVEYFVKLRESGKIGHLGFSGHGNMRTIQRFVSKFGKYLEFGQLQINWMDYDFQEAGDKLAFLNQRGMECIVMEPLRGGRLLDLSDEDLAKLDAMRPGEPVVDWSFRFLQGIDGVSITLSGMSDMTQMQQNIGIFDEKRKLTQEQSELLRQIGHEMSHKDAVPCTRCRYCTSHCKQFLDIPELISLYNEHMSTGGKGFIAPMALGGMKESRRPSACVGCKRCEVVCPQQIEISEIMRRMKEIKPW